MQFIIENEPVFTTLKVLMNSGESFRAESGAMLAMSPNVSLEAKSSGKGLIGTLKAAVGGESLFGSVFTANSSNAELILAPTTMGDILHIKLNQQVIFAQGGAYLAGDLGLKLSAKGSLRAMVSGEGLFLQEIAGSGNLFLSSYGKIVERELKAGESIIVDTGHIVAFDSNISYTVKRVAKGIFSSLASGEGLVCEYTGPGKLWLQTRNLPAFAHLISNMLPTKTS
ncbi:MAG TPA: TIGR00266 family protein [Candidatus Kapabacteria bacterium]|nr:TIGR00266 family protein [Candidatus Kapabacteria bacterium]